MHFSCSEHSHLGVKTLEKKLLEAQAELVIRVTMEQTSVFFLSKL